MKRKKFKKGTKFKVINFIHFFPIGSTIELFRDDLSKAPLFEGIGNDGKMQRWSIPLSRLKQVVNKVKVGDELL